jgi:hypothetical protein
MARNHAGSPPHSCRLAGLVLVAAVIVPSATAGSAVPSTPTWTVAPRSFVLLRGDSPGDARAFVDAAKAAGGHVSILYPEGAAVIYADDATLSKLVSSAWIDASTRESVDVTRIASQRPAASLAARAWNRSLELGTLTREQWAGGSPSAISRALYPRDAGPRPILLHDGSPIARRAASAGRPLGAEMLDTSEFMAGTVAVGVWLLESAGTTYDWTEEEKTISLAGVQAGLDAWVRRGGPAAFLTFILDVHVDVPVSGVPIEWRIHDDARWVDEALASQGWTGDNAYYKCFAYDNSIRDRFRTNWCYSMFIVDSDPGVNQGLFTDGQYAYANYGGPWLYMSRFSRWAYPTGGLEYAAAVPMHETGHIFMATDEYDAVQEFSGYWNASDDPSGLAICVMNQNDSSHVCQPTRDQIGWKDVDGNGVIDVLDRDPQMTLGHTESSPSPDPTPRWMGTANVVAYRNLNPNSSYSPSHDMTIATIDRVECRIDGGPWEPATPADGAFNDYSEVYFWSPRPQNDGLHLVEARARTSAGIETAAFVRDTLTLAGTVPSAPFLSAARPNPSRSGTAFDFSVSHAGRVRLGIYDASGRLVRTLVDGSVPGGWHSASWSGADVSDRDVASGVYFLRLDAEGSIETRRVVVLR